MSIPYHGDDCRTCIWPTLCPDCGANVFFLTCSCGSKVYLELSEPPWDEHREKCPGWLIRTMFQDGASAVAIRAKVEREAEVRGESVPLWAYSLINKLTGGGRPRGVVEAAPGEDPCDIVGPIININPQVNVMKRFNIPETPLARNLLGDLGKHPYVEITVHDSDDDTCFDHKFVFLLEKDVFERIRVSKGKHVKAELRPYTLPLPSQQKVWLATQIAVESKEKDADSALN